MDFISVKSVHHLCREKRNEVSSIGDAVGAFRVVFGCRDGKSPESARGIGSFRTKRELFFSAQYQLFLLDMAHPYTV